MNGAGWSAARSTAASLPGRPRGAALADTAVAAAPATAAPDAAGKAAARAPGHTLAGRSGSHPALLILPVCAWIATVGNLALWRGLEQVGALDGAAGALLAGGLGLAIFAALVAICSLLAWRFTLKPTLVLLLVLQAGLAHYMLAYRVVIDPSMWVNALGTDRREVRDLIGWPLLRDLGWLLLPPLLLVSGLKLRYRGFGAQLRRNLGSVVAMLIVLVLAVMAAFQPLSSTMRNHKSLRYLINPLNSLYAVGHVATEPLRRPRGPLQVIGADARLRPTAIAAGAGARPPLVVLVLGETARAGNFGLNGYARDTTPELATEPVVSLRDVTSCGTSTAASLPCMFSPLGREAYVARDHDSENLLDVLQRAGLAVLWLENQAGCKGVCDRVPSANTQDTRDPQLCPDGECRDEVLLQGLDARLAALPPERRARGTVLVLHTMGSHGPAYFRRSSPAQKRFEPECRSIDLQRCTRDELINAYDNSIRGVDHFLASTIRWLRSHEGDSTPAMVYIADHGESLGEHNLYLHGLPWALAPAEQKQVPWITWLSPGYASALDLGTACLQRRASAPATHDQLFHSMLGLMQVDTSVYQPELDLYAPCDRG